VKNSLDKAFKDKLEHGRASYPDDLWEKIEAQLPDPKDKAPTTLFGRFRFLGLALAFLGIALSFYIMSDNSTSIENELSQNLSSSVQAEKTVSKDQLAQSSEKVASADTQNSISKNITRSISTTELEKSTTSIQETNSGTSFSIQENLPITSLKREARSNTQESSKSFNVAAAETSIGLQMSSLPATNNTLFAFRENEAKSNINSKTTINTTNRNSTNVQSNNLGAESNRISSFQIIENLSRIDRREIDEVVNLKSNRRRYNAKKLLTECPAFIIKGRRGVILDFYFSPDFAMREFNPREVEFNNYSSERENSESPYLSYSAGMRFSYVNNSGLALRSGVNFTQINETFKYLNTNVTGIDTIIKIESGTNVRDTTFVEIGETVELKTHNRYRSIDVPLLVGLEMPFNKNVKLSLNAGVFVNLLFHQRGRYIDTQGHPNWFVGQNLYKTSLGLSYYGSLGVNYYINPRMDFLIEPNLRYYSQSFTVNAYPLTQEYLKFGLLTGVRYHF